MVDSEKKFMDPQNCKEAFEWLEICVDYWHRFSHPEKSHNWSVVLRDWPDAATAAGTAIGCYDEIAGFDELYEKLKRTMELNYDSWASKWIDFALKDGIEYTRGAEEGDCESITRFNDLIHGFLSRGHLGALAWEQTVSRIEESLPEIHHINVDESRFVSGKALSVVPFLEPFFERLPVDVRETIIAAYYDKYETPEFPYKI